ncbi:MAG: indolepyruvate ferredoxin oxidoreductase family protein, partial [SAR324 cluster bacterium]|nr:indolepyruvate ferredoxin oxidoreductase family protein [SAR324 cluster bacterium]
MEKRQVNLQDKYILEEGRAFMTGIQALVRLPMVQRRLDQSRGWDTGGFISGYRGSPLGALDQQLVLNRKLLEDHHVRFNPGVNEDLAATSIWGTQQAELHGQGRYDGVFGLWYGKGPGVDRSGDALRHANLAGTSARGGVLALMGDDHTCESSTTCHQSEFAMMDAMIPVFNPAGVQEILDFGLYGWALSRFSGCWVGLKCIHDTVESTATVDVSSDRCEILLPQDYTMPPEGLNIRWPDTPHEQEARLHEHKLVAARAFVRANRLNRILMDAPQAKIGIISTGKALLDTRLALDELGIGPEEAKDLGLRLMQIAMPWPLEPEGVKEFSRGLDLIMVVEEKRGLIEPQLKDFLYHTADAPQVIGKQDEKGIWLFPSAGALDPNHIALSLAERVLAKSSAGTSLEKDALAKLRDREARLRHRIESTEKIEESLSRLPYFCAGCPHNSSTVVPEGSHAYAGIGCHYMAQWMDRSTAGFTHMGAEGANWVGESFFSKREHVFQNIGDGTYFHSGLLAIRSAIAADVNVTFKILFNDAVAMTGGQPMDGPLTVPRITQQVRAEGAGEVVVVTDDPERYRGEQGLASGIKVYNREELDQVQRRLREIPGVTVLVYEQTCAAEKRRRRKRGRFPDPPRRIFINQDVCEGCGDCGVKSNCVAVLPLETDLGRKRMVDQSACNKDYSCANGLCPSFVSVIGGKPRKAKAVSEDSLSFPDLPEPELPKLDKSYNIVITGV